MESYEVISSFIMVGVIILVYRIGRWRGRTQVRKEWAAHQRWMDEAGRTHDVNRRWTDAIKNVTPEISPVLQMWFKEK